MRCCVLRECVRERIVVFSACRVCGVVLLGVSEKTALKKEQKKMSFMNFKALSNSID